jgi:hypothetical protein
MIIRFPGKQAHRDIRLFNRREPPGNRVHELSGYELVADFCRPMLKSDGDVGTSRRATGSQDRRAAACPQRIRLVPPLAGN